MIHEGPVGGPGPYLTIQDPGKKKETVVINVQSTQCAITKAQTN